MFFEKILVSDDILAERLLERTSALARVGMLERRVERLETWASKQGAVQD
jgi:hypothetical protein